LDWWNLHNIEMNFLSKSLTYDRRIKLKNNNSIGIADDKILQFLLKKLKYQVTISIQYMTLYMKKIQYWNKQGEFPAGQNNNIDWDVVKHTKARIPLNRKV